MKVIARRRRKAATRHFKNYRSRGVVDIDELGLKALHLSDKQIAIKEFRGKLAWEGDLKKMRRD